MNDTLKKFSTWAYNHSNPRDPKYNSLSHPLMTAIKSTLIFILSSLLIRNTFFSIPPQNSNLQPSSPYFGVFLILYLLVMISSRVVEGGYNALYETLWACNQCILLGGIACILRDGLLLRVVLVVVSVDQLLWFVDIGGYILKKKFIVGVAKYIIWPQTTKVRLATTFHHIWFLPLCLWLIHPTSKHSSFTPQIFFLACILCQILVILGRISTPKQITIKTTEQEQKTIYMNLNLSWQLWKDLRMGFLKYFYKHINNKSLIFVVAIVWDLGNLGGFVFFWALEKITKSF